MIRFVVAPAEMKRCRYTEQYTFVVPIVIAWSWGHPVEAGALDPIKTDLLGIQALGPCLRKRACSCINTDMIGSKGSGRSDCTFWKRHSTPVLG